MDIYSRRIHFLLPSVNSEPVDISDVQLTEEEKSTLSSEGLKTKKIEEIAAFGCTKLKD